MGRPREDLDAILSAIPGVKDAYFQAPTTMQYPCIKYDLDDAYTARADNGLYWDKDRYKVTIIDRDGDSVIHRYVRALPYSSPDRKYVIQGLHHWVYTLFF